MRDWLVNHGFLKSDAVAKRDEVSYKLRVLSIICADLTTSLST